MGTSKQQQMTLFIVLIVVGVLLLALGQVVPGIVLVVLAGIGLATVSGVFGNRGGS